MPDPAADYDDGSGLSFPEIAFPDVSPGTIGSAPDMNYTQTLDQCSGGLTLLQRPQPSNDAAFSGQSNASTVSSRPLEPCEEPTPLAHDGEIYVS
jgi:hypothetical protein